MIFLRCWVKQIKGSLRRAMVLSERLPLPPNNNTPDCGGLVPFFWGGMVLFSFLGSLESLASESYQEGKAFAEEIAPVSLPPLDLKTVPHYGGEGISESNYIQTPEQITEAAAALTHGEGQDIGGRFKRRP
jgi:hypothetical protein